ncbi:KTSC domain-containing protein [Fusobacterium mortiferum]|uniref:KTSC domain-containing protein n=1 Tax=Fusobacterium mortiferum ATCC 9817 TaxID=469616 RepID=A0ABM6TY95_FUSMR|nr:KTSC domain-containing protein [Fusobacterium mortiferum]AVQ19373.1 KTSC domain-containing protein [Fusobacterium mortiferum ATCC 9817]EEO36216.1 hypothetical protein FMAG_01778 [Fusobacterium mortiferum ATCC 9817]
MILRKDNLDSSQIKDIEYNTENQTMIVRFQDRVLKSGIVRKGKRYLYKNVPQEIYEIIISAKTNPEFEFSHGKCFHKLVKIHEELFPCTKLD